MSVHTESIAVHTAGSAQDADADRLDRLEQEIAALDAQILAAVRRRSDLARTLAPVELPTSPTGPATHERFDGLGSDGPVLGRLLSRLSLAHPR
ncbi:chorismate mutase [Rhodococcus sp. ABRD24]|uniref:chorismate mutase n=1 Tax=Rhodococcus sp. ABRD24 TaxID=2507582 RepID=UPI00103D4C68|nr:chorismate mutase [Rhodococcus sp. ABRD24]QBJ97848.1 chorismate mutase [Rhodococcus sp. ABRD24]